MVMISTGDWLLRAVVCLGAVFSMADGVWAQSPTFSITLTGQSAIRSDVRAHAPATVPTIASLLKGDVVFTNFEATIFDVKKGQSPPDGRFNDAVLAAFAGKPLGCDRTRLDDRPGPCLFLSPPEALDSLKTFGFNLLSLSNNHSWDLKVPGIENALEQAKRLDLGHAGIGHTVDGAAAPGYMHTPKGTVALVAMASGFIADGGSATATRPGVNELRVERNAPNPEDAQRILRSIRDAKQRAELVIVSQHNHVFDKPFATIMAERLPERLVPPEWLKKWTHAEVDAGADIIVMHGAPLLHGVEIYRDRPIFFDLGNFIFQPCLVTVCVPNLDEPVLRAPPEEAVRESVVAYVEFEGKSLKSVRFRPIALDKIGQGQADTRGLPRPATGDQAHYILERLADLSRPFGTNIEAIGDSAEIKLKAGN